VIEMAARRRAQAAWRRGRGAGSPHGQTAAVPCPTEWL